MKEFDEDEYRVSTTDTSRTANFLTEAGLEDEAPPTNRP